MKTRIISAVILAVAAFALIYFGGIAFDIAVLLLAAVAMYELFSAFKKKGHSPVIAAGVISLLIIAAYPFSSKAVPGIIGFSWLKGINAFGIILTLMIFYVLAAIVIKHEKYNIVDASLSIMGSMYIVFLFSYFIMLRHLEAGAYMIILAILGCVGGDTAALVIGCKFGKKKLIPKVSPNKTVAGSVAAFCGSILTCTAYGLLLHILGRFPQFQLYHYIIVGVILGAVTQIGDLCASAIKRYCGIKDFGNIIPGHGGILDRFDAYLLAVPVVYYYYGFFMMYLR